jgi:hypothetical protein
MQTIVQWLRSEENPLILKIAAVTFASSAAIGIGLLTGHVVLVSSVLAIPILIWAVDENAIVERVELARQRVLRSFQLMQDAVGGVAVFNQYPILNIGNRMGHTGYLDFLTPQDLTRSVMRGTDLAGRPFISLKLRSSRPEDRSRGAEFVVTFFQRYKEEGRWVYGTSDRRNLFGDVIGDEDRAAIRQIVVTRNHPHFTLV